MAHWNKGHNLENQPTKHNQLAFALTNCKFTSVIPSVINTMEHTDGNFLFNPDCKKTSQPPEPAVDSETNELEQCWLFKFFLHFKIISCLNNKALSFFFFFNCRVTCLSKRTGAFSSKGNFNKCNRDGAAGWTSIS